MKFFRNREIRYSLIWFGIVDVLLTIAAFTVDIVCGIFVCFTGVLLTGMYVVITYKRYQQIAALSREIDALLHDEENFRFQSYQEGELAILQNEIDKMTIRLREQAEHLRRDKRYMEDSLADISHQMRTPLTAINLVIERLQQPGITERQRNMLIRELFELLSRMEWLINTLLKISKLDSGTANMVKESVAVSGLIRHATAPFAVVMDLHDQKLHIEVQEQPVFEGDFSWSNEAVSNIIKNCIEHTPDGGEVWIYGRETPLFTEMIIEDNGTGIDQKDLPHLFERFYKGKDAGSQSVGIGLALSRMIITAQNGTIKVENRKEGGARFIIRFYKEII